MMTETTNPLAGEMSTPQGPGRRQDIGWTCYLSARWRWWLACLLVFAGSLAATVPTTGDFGLTWDEPAYRFSQQRSAEWWHQLARARTSSEREALLEPDALLFYWTYGRHGINFHPPLAGQLNLLTYELFGRWMKDIPARRMASVIEYALTITIGFGFLSRRYGTLVGLVAAGALLFMPRVYGDAHLATTDPPGLLLWAATAVAFWNGLYLPDARGWRVLVGILLGLAFVEKMAAVFVLAPLLLWLVVARVPGTFKRQSWKGDWIDGVVTSGAMLLPLGLVFLEILRLAKVFPIPRETNLFVDRPTTNLPGLILAAPLGVWILRRLLGRMASRSAIWGVERPGLELWTAVLAFAPVIGWLGNPEWWKETLPRLAHYYTINKDRPGSLPDIQIFYLGQTYEYSLPWHNGWILIGVTVPVSLLIASALGLLRGLGGVKRDRLPLFFLVNFLTIPVARMLPTPAHDGVRLMLPTFFFLAAFTGWGAGGLADLLTNLLRGRASRAIQSTIALLILAPAAWQLVKIHPFELSYYNEAIGGPRGAWKAGFELTYWYDAFTPQAIDELNKKLPDGIIVDFLNDKTNPMTFSELHALGELKPDVKLGRRKSFDFPYVWLLTQDSKASAFTRLLFTMKPWYSQAPKQLDGLRVATVADVVAGSRARALWLMLDRENDHPPEQPVVPKWVRSYAPFLGRVWGEGIKKVQPLTLNSAVFDWASTDPEGFLKAARLVSEQTGSATSDDPDARRLRAILDRYSEFSPGDYARTLLRTRPEAVVEAARIIVKRPDALRTILTNYGYTDPSEIGGYLDDFSILQ